MEGKSRQSNQLLRNRFGHYCHAGSVYLLSCSKTASTVSFNMLCLPQLRFILQELRHNTKEYQRKMHASGLFAAKLGLILPAHVGACTCEEAKTENASASFLLFSFLSSFLSLCSCSSVKFAGARTDGLCNRSSAEFYASFFHWPLPGMSWKSCKPPSS